MQKFWIVLPLAPTARLTVPPSRYDYLEGDGSATEAAAAMQRAAPSRYGFAIMECVKVTGSLVPDSNDLPFTEPTPAPARPPGPVEETPEQTAARVAAAKLAAEKFGVAGFGGQPGLAPTNPDL